METFFLDVDGYKIRCAIRGQGANLVLIHGLGGSLEWWKYNFDYLSLKYRVIVFDFPGFGYSTKPQTGLSLDLASSFMRSFLDTLNLLSFSLIGNSLGGLIALYVASDLEERVDNLILVSNAGFSQELSFLLRLASLYPCGEIAFALRNFFTARLFLSRLFYDSRKLPVELINCVLEIFDNHLSRKFCLQVLRSGVDLGGLKDKILGAIKERAVRLTLPTLIIWGRNDKIIPVSQAYQGRDLIRNSDLFIFENCGHLPQIEKRDEFNQLIVNYLK